MYLKNLLELCSFRVPQKDIDTEYIKICLQILEKAVRTKKKKKKKNEVKGKIH